MLTTFIINFEQDAEEIKLNVGSNQLRGEWGARESEGKGSDGPGRGHGRGTNRGIDSWDCYRVEWSGVKKERKNIAIYISLN